MLRTVKRQIINTGRGWRGHFNAGASTGPRPARDAVIYTGEWTRRIGITDLDLVDTTGAICIHDRIIEAERKDAARGHKSNLASTVDTDIRQRHSGKAGKVIVLRRCGGNARCRSGQKAQLRNQHCQDDKNIKKPNKSLVHGSSEL